MSLPAIAVAAPRCRAGRLDQPELRRLRCAFEEAALAGGKIVVADDAVAGGEKPIDQVAADEAGGAGDECLHVYFLAKTQARITVKLRVEDIKIPIKSAIETSKRKPVLAQ